MGKTGPACPKLAATDPLWRESGDPPRLEPGTLRLKTWLTGRLAHDQPGLRA